MFLRSFGNIAIFCSVLLLGLTVTMSVADSPRIHTKTSEFQFDPLLEGDSVSHTFRFVNEGEAPLLIDRVRTSCGCTAAVVSSKRIAPGEAGELNVTFDSSGFRGQVTKTIYLYTNDPKQPKTHFMMAGRVQPLLDADPLRLRFSGMKPGVAQQMEVQLTNRSQQPLTLTSVRSTVDAVTVSSDKALLQPGENTSLTVTATLPKGGKRLSGYVMVGTDHPKVTALRLVVRGYPNQ